MEYLFNGHSSFYIREGWIQKGIRYLQKEDKENAFSKTNIGAIDELGIGSVMVQALRFWLVIFDLIKKENKKYVLKREVEYLLEKDPYFQNNNTLWLLHSYIMGRDNNEETVVLWELILRSKKLNNFDLEEVKSQLNIFFKEKKLSFSERSIKDSIDVFIKTYHKNTEVVSDPENNMHSPFTRLNYLEQSNTGEYRFKNILAKEISEYIVLSLIERRLEKEEVKQVTVKDAYESFDRIIRMRPYEYEKLLGKLENKGHLSIDRAGGLSNIVLKEVLTEREIINRMLESE